MRRGGHAPFAGLGFLGLRAQKMTVYRLLGRALSRSGHFVAPRPSWRRPHGHPDAVVKLKVGARVAFYVDDGETTMHQPGRGSAG